MRRLVAIILSLAIIQPLQAIPGHRPKKWNIKPPIGQIIDQNNSLTKDLKVVFDFREGGGLAINNAIPGNVSGTITGTGVTWVGAKNGKGLQGSGTDRVTLANFPSSSSGNLFSYEILIFPTSFPVSATLLAVNGSAGWYIRTTGKLSQFSGGFTDFTTVLTANNWYHIVFVNVGTAGGLSVYINGVKDATSVTSLSSWVPTVMINNSGNNLSFNGIVEYERFWLGKALTLGEIQQLYMNPYIIYKDQNPTLWWMTSPEQTVVSYTPLQRGLLIKGGSNKILGGKLEVR